MERFNKYLVGWDRMVDEILRIGESSYPPHNIRKLSEDSYQLELALAGFSEKDIDVSVESNVLTISSTKQIKEDDVLVHRGIAARAFTRSFVLEKDVVVDEASLKDGLLKISLTRVIPDHLKPRKIFINAPKAQLLNEDVF
jgi:molecular chaperone IbpA